MGTRSADPESSASPSHGPGRDPAEEAMEAHGYKAQLGSLHSDLQTATILQPKEPTDLEDAIDAGLFRIDS